MQAVGHRKSLILFHLENHRDSQGPVNTGHVWDSRLILILHLPDSYDNLRRKRCHSLFHSWAPTTTHCITAAPPHFRRSQLNHSFPHWQGCVKHLPAALPQTSHIEFKSSPPHHPFQSSPALNRY